MNRAGTALSIAALALISFFIFPGHTYLQQDTQIYVPILERQWSGALAGDPVAEQQHVSFTLYDELANALRGVTHLPLQYVLEGEQILFRALGIWGVFLIATALGLGPRSALAVAALAVMGADIPGPAILAVEYEPTPRAFAVPLVLLSIGFVFRERYWLAGLAGGCAVLLHAPSTWPLWVALAAASVVNRRIVIALLPLLAATLALVCIAAVQGGAAQQHLLAPLPASQQALQRMRTAYDYVSLWPRAEFGRYLLIGIAGTIALLNLRMRRDRFVFLAAFVFIGLASIPLSWLLLEAARLAITPQIQPARALLFLVVVSSIAGAIAACRALRSRKWMEAASWLIFCIALPLTNPPAVQIEGPDLLTFANWARTHPGIYAFPESGHSRAPGWFRAVALQPVYVDWKGGGQVNYLQGFGEVWWQRWQATMNGLLTPERYRQLGIRYVALPRTEWPARAPAFHNDSWTVYPVWP